MHRFTTNGNKAEISKKFLENSTCLFVHKNKDLKLRFCSI